VSGGAAARPASWPASPGRRWGTRPHSPHPLAQSPGEAEGREQGFN
jgi:hypothetical protein